MRSLAVAFALALLSAFVALPTAEADPTCTGYRDVLGSKQQTCVDPEQAPQCGAWTEGWSPPLGYFKTCYGTGMRCGDEPCLDRIEISGCIEWLCLV